jgi:hypothetical protein
MVLAELETGTSLATVILWTEVSVMQNDFYSISCRRLEITTWIQRKVF